MERTRSWIQLNFAVCLFGLSAILATQMTVSPVLMVWGRALFAFLAIHGVLALRGVRPWRNRRPMEAGKLCLAGLVLAFHWIAFFMGVKHGGVALATLGFASFPAFVIILTVIIYKEKPLASDLAVIALISLGLIMVTPSFDISAASSAGLIWGIISGLLYAVVIIGNRYLTKGVAAVESCWWQYLAISLLLLTVSAGTLPSISGRDWFWILLMGLVCTGLAFTLFVTGLPKVRTSEAAVISAMEPVYAIAMAWIFLGEAPSVKTMAGGAVILSAVVWAALKSR